MAALCACAPSGGERPEEPAVVSRPVAIEEACEQTGRWIERQLGPGAAAVVRPPLVVCGDLPPAELERWHDRHVAPLAAALQAQLFSSAPDEPITVLLFAGESSYRGHARRLFGLVRVSRFGCYREHLRMSIVNVEPGPSGLRHELTHALMAFDFPDAPAWLSEGLASLYEECTIDGDGRLLGQANWRRAELREAMAAGRLRPIESLLRVEAIADGDESLNYAHAQAFCHFLQEAGLLAECYRRVRANRRGDPTGVESVLALFPGRTWDELDAELRREEGLGIRD